MFPVDEIRFGIALSQIAGTRGVGIGVKEGCIQGDRLIESHVLIPRRGAEDGIQPVTNADSAKVRKDASLERHTPERL